MREYSYTIDHKFRQWPMAEFIWINVKMHLKNRSGNTTETESFLLTDCLGQIFEFLAVLRLLVLIAVLVCWSGC